MTNLDINRRQQPQQPIGPSTINFTDEASGSTSITSSWKQSEVPTLSPVRPLRSNSPNPPVRPSCPKTKRFSFALCNTNSSFKCQTIPEPEKQFKLLSNVNCESLCGFLGKVEGMVSRELMRNARSSAFEGYTVRWDEEISSISCMLSMENGERETEMACTDISWNKSGSIVGVGYGRYDHTGWCTHKGYLCCWNLSLRDFNPTSATFRTETPNCVMAIAFHPETPNMIVAERLMTEDMGVAMSKMSENSHQEPIAKVMSVGNDGKIIIWALDSNSIKVKAGSIITKNSIPRNLRTSEKNFMGDSPIGVTSLSISKESRTDYIAGTETGFIFKCNLSLAGVKYTSPTQFSYQPHIGPATGVSFSPFHRNLFLTSGDDGTVRLYHKLQVKQLFTWEPVPNALLSVEWSPYKPSVFAVASSDGHVYFYNLMKNRSLPISSIKVSDEKHVTCTSVAFNQKRPDLFATGDSLGFLKVWKLTTALSSSDPVEDKLIKMLGDVQEDAVV
ncbi:WD40-repeat-containing domain protein [Chytridium lagenaria]|nr:WD40-repeat-containing domain protein [Chytridium lagenaria]